MSVLRIDGLVKTYVRNGVSLRAVDGVSLTLDEGEALGIVGESGCGKSTLLKAVCQLIPFDSGEVEILGQRLPVRGFAGRRSLYRNVQMVFQNPIDSFDPKIPLGRSITEAARNFGMPPREAEARLYEMLGLVGLQADYAERLPHQVSGGECQRAAIARALLVRPKVLVCDEATSALDVSAQAQVLALLRRVRAELAVSLLFITHDLAVAQNLCDRIAVMRAGRIVEEGPAGRVINEPRSDYTKMLLESVLSVDEGGLLPGKAVEPL